MIPSPRPGINPLQLREYLEQQDRAIEASRRAAIVRTTALLAKAEADPDSLPAVVEAYSRILEKLRKAAPAPPPPLTREVAIAHVAMLVEEGQANPDSDPGVTETLVAALTRLQKQPP